MVVTDLENEQEINKLFAFNRVLFGAGTIGNIEEDLPSVPDLTSHNT